MSVDDYFTKNMYRGKIYKTTNMLGQTLAQYCNTEEALTAEQKRIEKELVDFEKNIWGDPAKKDSLDSIAKIETPKAKKEAKKTRKEASDSKTKVKASKPAKSSSSSSSSPRVSVRRERH